MKTITLIYLILLSSPCWSNEAATLHTVCAQLLDVLYDEKLLAQVRNSQSQVSQMTLQDFRILEVEQIEKLTQQPINREIFLGERANISDFRGSSTFAIYTGRLDGRKVFIKVSYYPIGQIDRSLVNEARWLTYLAPTKVVPELFGFVAIAGHLAMVSEYIEGYQIYYGIEKRIDLLKQKWSLEERELIAKQFLSIGQILEQVGPIQMIDAQYRMTPGGRTLLIDLESFKWEQSANAHQNPINWSKKLAAQILEMTPE